MVRRCYQLFELYEIKLTKDINNNMTLILKCIIL